jgi:excisionase family DNA binding protein
MPEKLYTPSEVAVMFGVTPYTVRLWIKYEKIRGIKLPNRQWRIPQSALEEFVSVEGG